MLAVHLTWQALREYDPQPSRAGGQDRYLCPFCGDAKPRDRAHKSLVVHPSTGAYLCHRCGARGKLRNADGEESSPVRPRRKRKPPRWTPPTPPQATESLQTALTWQYRPLRGTAGEEYLRGRGIDVDLAHRAGVRYCERFADAPAVVCPFRTHAGNLIALQGRYIVAHEPKVRTYGSVTAGVFATPTAWDAGTVAVAEAPIDALSLHIAGVPSFALGGTALRVWLPPLLAGRVVLLAFDADGAGDRAAQEWDAELRRFAVKPIRLRPPTRKDWNEELQAHGRDWVAEHIAGVLAGVEPATSPPAGVTCPQCGAGMEFFPTLADYVCLRCYARYGAGESGGQPATSPPAGAGYGTCKHCGGVLDVAQDGTLYCIQCRWVA